MLLQLKELIRSKQNKPFTFIVNSIGMMLAFTVIVIMFAHTYSELNHDSNVAHRDDIVRIETSPDWGLTPGAYGPWLANTLPEIRHYCRLYKEKLAVCVPAQENIEELLTEEEVIQADSTYSALFSLHFLQGGMQEGTDKVIVSQTTAGRLFGTTNPIGKQLILNDKINLTVTAVFQDVTNPAVYNPKIIVPIANNQLWTSRYLDLWGGDNFETYLLLNKGSDHKQVNAKFRHLYAQRLNESGHLKAEEITASLKNATLREYTDIYFNPLLIESCNHGNLSNVRVLVLIALLVLLVSIINYVNIATAKVADQARSIGLKRTLGARRLPLVYSIILDAIATCFIAMAIAFFMAWHLSPYLEQWIGLGGMPGIDLTLVVTLLSGIPIVCGILSGLFPAIYLTRLNGLTSNGHESPMLRKFKSTLMVAQFAISLGLIISTLLIYKQVNYVKTLNPGYDRSNIVVVYGDDASRITEKYPAFRSLLLQSPDILKVGISRDPIYNIGYAEAPRNVAGWDKGMIPATFVDTYLPDALGLNIIEGTKIQGEELKMLRDKVIINEQMAKTISSLTPRQNYLEGNRIAVVKDFNYKPMHEAIGPMFLRVTNPEQIIQGRGYIYIRIAPEHPGQSLTHIKNCYSRLYPGMFYRYSFMDDDYNRLYGNESRFADRLFLFSILSIAIACLGLLAFAIFFIEQNMKNISIRKVVGATETQILSLLNRDLLMRLLTGFLISCPVVYYAITRWLSPFAYKTELSWWVFAGAFAMIVCVALLSVSYLTWKAAKANPVDSLKKE